MPTDTVVLDSVTSALSHDVGTLSPGELVVVREGPARRRSSLYFLGLAGSPVTCRWVLKCPNSESQQEDLRSPLSALGQFEALQRLHGHLRQSGASVSTPRPVAYLPELGAYLMEYVQGPTVTALITPRAVVNSTDLLRAVTGSAQVLRAVHSLELAEAEVLDVQDLSRHTGLRGRQLLESVGLPVRDRWFVPGDHRSVTTARRVVLHGDFAPENVVQSPSGFCCLEPDLTERGWAEHDVVRFLLMLVDAPLFVVGAGLPPVRDLRRTAAATFLDGYYGDGHRPEALQPLMIESLAARWHTRHTDLARRSPRLRRTRAILLRRHFGRLLDEVSSPDWLAARR